MKRFILSAMVLGTVSLFNIGCSEEAKVEKKETVSTPSGTTEKTTTTKVEKSGEAPPATPGGPVTTPAPK